MTEIDIEYYNMTSTDISLIPKRIGSYVITHTPDNIHAEKYVGSTNNLFSRICAHNDKEIICIDLFITDNMELAESLERILIDIIEPATNKRIPPLSDNDKTIMDKLLRDTNIKKYTSNNIVRIGFRYLKYITQNDNVQTKSIIFEDECINIPFIDQRKITKASHHGILTLNLNALRKIGLDTGKKYTVIYDENKVIITNKKLKSVTFD